MSTSSDFAAVRKAIAAFPADVATDAIGTHRPTIDEIFSPENHAGALDTLSPIVVGARGTGKSFGLACCFNQHYGPWRRVPIHDGDLRT